MSMPAPELGRGRGSERLSGREADLLRELAETVNASLDMDVVLQRVTEAARELCRSDVARIALREAGADALAFRYWVGAGVPNAAAMAVTVGRGLAGQVLATGQAVRKPDVLNESLPTIPRLVQADGIRSVLIVPVRIRDRIEGLIEVDNRSLRPFGEREEGLLRRLAEHAAVAIRNSQIFAAERKAAEQERSTLLEREEAARAEAEVAQGRLSLLEEASTLLAGSLDYETTLQSLARLTVPAPADMCVIDMLADDGTIRRVAAAHINPELSALVATVQQRFPPDPKGPHPVATVLRSPQLVSEITEPVLAAIAPDPEHWQIARALAYTSFVVVPLVARERTLGALSLVSGESGRHYTASDLALAEDLARRASLAVDNARLYTESEQRRRIAEALTATGRLPSPARSDGGLGIGLTLVRRLVELHGGEVSARSEGKGRGSEFIVRLPADPVVANASDARPASALGPARSVLVVEDNPDNAQMLQACLELDGHRVLVTGNGADAVTLAVRECPDAHRHRAARFRRLRGRPPGESRAGVGGCPRRRDRLRTAPGPPAGAGSRVRQPSGEAGRP